MVCKLLVLASFADRKQDAPVPNSYVSLDWKISVEDFEVYAESWVLIVDLNIFSSEQLILR